MHTNTQTHTTSSSLPIFRIAINLSIHLSDVFLNIFFQTPSTTPKRKKEGIIHCMKYNHSLYMPVTLVHDIILMINLAVFQQRSCQCYVISYGWTHWTCKMYTKTSSGTKPKADIMT